MKKLLIPIFLTFALLACSGDDEGNPTDCPSNTACTLDFRTLMVTITDSDDRPVVLDDYMVTEVATGKDITIEPTDYQWEQFREDGEYPLFSDQYSQEYQNQEVEIRFIGYVDGEEVVRADYTVGADCCHIHLVEGDTSIQIGG
jgi:hypothetical protein